MRRDFAEEAEYITLLAIVVSFIHRGGGGSLIEVIKEPNNEYEEKAGQTSAIRFKNGTLLAIALIYNKTYLQWAAGRFLNVFFLKGYKIVPKICMINRNDP